MRHGLLILAFGFGCEKPGPPLKQHTASAVFADRADVEIAADDDVPYADLVAVLDVAAKAGFVDWRLTTPRGLAALPRQ